MEHDEGLVVDAATKVWTGELPDRCRSVYVQWLSPDGEWLPKPKQSVSRPKTHAYEKLQEAVAKGPLKFAKYRLIPANIEYDEQSTEEGAMPKKKSMREKTARPPLVLVAGKFRPGTFRAKVFELLTGDGKARTAEAIVKAIGAAGNLNKRTPRLFVVPIIVDIRNGGFQVTEGENETFSMKKLGAGGASPDKPAPEKSKPKVAGKPPAKKSVVPRAPVPARAAAAKPGKKVATKAKEPPPAEAEASGEPETTGVQISS